MKMKKLLVCVAAALTLTAGSALADRTVAKVRIDPKTGCWEKLVAANDFRMVFMHDGFVKATVSTAAGKPLGVDVLSLGQLDNSGMPTFDVDLKAVSGSSVLGPVGYGTFSLYFGPDEKAKQKVNVSVCYRDAEDKF